MIPFGRFDYDLYPHEEDKVMQDLPQTPWDIVGDHARIRLYTRKILGPDCSEIEELENWIIEAKDSQVFQLPQYLVMERAPEFYKRYRKWAAKLSKQDRRICTNTLFMPKSEYRNRQIATRSLKDWLALAEEKGVIGLTRKDILLKEPVFFKDLTFWLSLQPNAEELDQLIYTKIGYGRGRSKR